MTVTYVNLAGTYEHPDLTIKYHLDTNWNAANTNSEEPTYYSAAGTNVSHSWPRTFGTNEIHCNTEEMESLIEEANGNTYAGVKYLVYIDIFARDANLLKLFIKEVQRIIWEISPNSGTRLLKSNGTQNSSISRFGSSHISFKKERSMEPNIKLQPHASGVLEVIMHKVKT